MKPNPKSLLIISICLIYVALRIWRLTDSCLWFDEIFSIHAAEMGWHEMFWFVAQDLIHPPLFYIFLKIWISIGGESLFWLRLFPVFFSAIALISFYFLCRQLKLSAASLAVAFILFAVNGNLIKYAQEVRMYSVLLCLSVFSLWLFVRYLNSGKGIWVLTLINILLVHTQYFGWFLVAAEVIVLLYLQRVKIGQMMIMFGFTILSAIPWTIAVLQAARLNSDVSQNLSWAGRPDFPALIRFVLNLTEPFYFQSSSIDATSIWQIGLPLLFVIITSACFYFVDWRVRDEKEKNAITFLLIIVFAPIVFAFALSWLLPFSIWGTRHFIIIFAPYSILVAKIIGGIKIEGLRIGLVVLGLIIVCAALYHASNRQTAVPIWCAWESLANTLDGSEPNGREPINTAVYTFEDLVAYHFWFAMRESERGVRVYKINNIAGMTEDTAYFIPRGFNGITKIDFEAIRDDRFFIAFRYHGQEQMPDPQNPPLKTFVEKGYKIREPKSFEAGGSKAFLVELQR